MADITGGDEVIGIDVKGTADLDDVIRDLDRLEDKLEKVRMAAKDLGSSSIGKQVGEFETQISRLKSATADTGQVTDATRKAFSSLETGLNGLDKNVATVRKQMIGFNGDAKVNRQGLKQWQKEMGAVGVAVKAQAPSWDLFKRNVSNAHKNLRDSSRTTVASLASINALDTGKPLMATSLGSMRALKAETVILRKQLDGLFHTWQNHGKQMQWSGMQLIQGVTLPIIGLGTLAMNSFMSVGKEMLQLKKVTEFSADYEKLGGYIEETAVAFGISQRAATGMYKDIAALGVQGEESIKGWADSIAQLQMIGDIDTSSATDFFRVTNALFAKGDTANRLKETNDMMANFNAIADDTSLQLKDLSISFPQAAPVMKMLGFNANETAAALAGMYQSGVDASEGANGLKTAMTRLAAPTGRTKELLEGLDFSLFTDGNIEDANAKIVELSRAMAGLNQESYAEVANHLFGKHQISRMQIYFDSVVAGQAEIDAAMADGKITMDESAKFQSDWAKALVASGEVAVEGMDSAGIRYQKALEAFQKDPTVMWAKVKTQFGIILNKIGAIIAPVIIEWGERIAGFIDKLLSAPPALLKFAAGFAVVIAAAGPVMYVLAQGINTVAAFGLAIDKLLPKMKDINKAQAIELFKKDPNRTDITQMGDAFFQQKEGRFASMFGKKKGVTVSAEDILGTKALDEATEDLADATNKTTAATVASTAAQDAHSAAMARAVAAEEALSAAKRSSIDVVDEQMSFDFDKDGALPKQQALFDADNLDVSKRKIGDIADEVTDIAEIKPSSGGVGEVVDDLVSPKKKSGLMNMGMNLLGVAGGIGKIATVGIVASGVIAAVAGAALAVVVAFKYAKDNWDYLYAAMKPGIDAIKAAWGEVKAAVGEIVSGMGDIFGKMFKGEGGEDPRTNAMNIGDVIGKLASIVAWAMRGIAAAIKWTWPFFERMAYIARDVFGFISSLLAGDFSQALEFAKAAVYEFVRPFWVINQQIVNAMVVLASTIAHILSSIAGMMAGFFSWLGSLPILGTVFKPLANGAKNSLLAMQGYFDKTRTNIDGFSDKVSGSIGKLDRKFRDGMDGSLNGLGPDLADKIDESNPDVTDAAGDLGGDAGEALNDGAADAVDADAWMKDWLSKIKSRLDKAIEDIRSSAKKALELYQESVLATYDARIKVIEDTEKAEEKLYKTEEYLAKKREMLRKRQVNVLNYQNARALAIYEGRIDDARMIDLDYQDDTEDFNKDIQDIETDRQRDLVKEQRDAMREKINEEKEGAQKILAIQKEAFEKQLALITEYAPRTVAEFDAMLAKVNGLLQQYGVSTWPETARGGMERFQEVFAQANEDIIQDFAWSGDAAITAWMGRFISPEALAILRMNGEKAGGAAGGGMGAGIEPGFDSTAPDSLEMPGLELPAFDFGGFWEDFLDTLSQGWGPVKDWIFEQIIEPVYNMFADLANGVGSVISTITFGKIELPEFPEWDFNSTGGSQAMYGTEKDLDGIAERGGQVTRDMEDNFSRLGDSIKATFRDSASKANQNTGSVSDNWHTASGLIQSSAQNAASGIDISMLDASTKVTGYSDELGNHWTMVNGQLVNQFGETGTRVTDASGRMTGIMNDNTGALSTKWRTETSGMKNQFDSVSGGISGRASSTGSGISAAMGSGAAGAASSFGFIGTVFGAVVSNISRVWSSLTGLISSGISFARNPFQAVFNAFKDVIEKIWNSLPGVLRDAVSFFGDALSNLRAVRLASGAKVPATRGGVAAMIAEGGYDEYVITTDPSKRTRSMSLLAGLMSDMGLTGGAKRLANGRMNVRMPSSGIASISPGTNGAGSGGASADTYIHVDTFIGQEEWFNGMMERRDIKVVKPGRKSTGQQNRVMKTYNDRYKVQP